MTRKKTEDEKQFNLLKLNTREVLKLKAGKEIIWHILSMCGIYDDTFTGNSQSFYLEGKRAVGLEILQLLEDADPTFYPKLLLEKTND